MDGVIWLFLAQVIGLAVLAVALVGLHRRPSGLEPDLREFMGWAGARGRIEAPMLRIF
jgi:hypothetical protein